MTTGTPDDTTRADGRVSLGDLENQLRSIGGSATQALKDSKTNAAAAGAVAALFAVAGSYVLGRRRGRKRATVLEIRRA